MSTRPVLNSRKFAIKSFQCMNFAVRNRAFQSRAHWPIYWVDSMVRLLWLHSKERFMWRSSDCKRKYAVCCVCVCVNRYFTVMSILNIFGHVSHCWHPAKYILNDLLINFDDPLPIHMITIYCGRYSVVFVI